MVCRPLARASFAFALMVAAHGPSHAAPAADKVACPDIAGLVVSDLKRSIIVGEVHGTNESPAFVAALACHILASGHGAKVALEIPRTEQERIRRYFLSAGTAADRAAMLSGAFWSADIADGRSSAAMVDLIERLRHFRSVNLPLLDVISIDVPVGDTGSAGERDRALSQAFEAVTRSPGDYVIALVGNYHAKKTVGAPWNAQARFMAGFLSADSVTSLDVAYSGGAAWMCTPECGVSDFGASKKAAGAPSGFSFRLPPKGGAYDATYGVGSLTASLPARKDPG